MYTMICSALLALPGAPPDPMPPVLLTASDLFAGDTFLVEAVALKAGTFQVTHVYVGPASLQDQTCSGHLFYPEKGSFQSMRPEKWQLESGKECLCWVVKSEKDEKLVIYQCASPTGRQNGMRDLDPIYFFPVKKSDKAYDQLSALARFYEKVYRAKDGDRFQIIDKYLRGQDADSGAFFWISRCKRAEVKADLRDLALDKSVPVPNQILAGMVVREALSDDEIAKAVTRWFREQWRNPPHAWGLSAERVLADYLPGRTKLFTPAQLVELLISGLANPERSEVFRQDILWFGFAGERRKAAWSQLMSTLGGKQPAAIQVAAVRLLEVFDTHKPLLNEEELTKLQAILPNLTDERARSMLAQRLETGMKIKEVIEFGPAQRAGLHPGDVIISVGGSRVRNSDELAAALAGAKGAVDLVVILGITGTRETISVKPLEGKLYIVAEPGRKAGKLVFVTEPGRK